MKNILYVICCLFIIRIEAQTQNVYSNIPSTGMSCMSKWMLQTSKGYAEKPLKQTNSIHQPLLEKPAGVTAINSSVTVNWQKFTGSHNIYGVLNSGSKPLQYHPLLNIVSFIHTKNITYTSSPGNGRGDVVAMISGNWGTTWDSTCIWNDTTKRAVYPQGGIYNPPGNTSSVNAYVVGTGATIYSNTISGNFYASKQIGFGNYTNAASTVSNATQFFSNVTPPSFGKHDLSSHSFYVTDDGTAHSLANIVNDVNATTNPAYGITGAMLVMGSFSGGTFNWSGTTFTPNVVTRTDGSLQMANKPIMAWDNNGIIGYVVIIGSLQSNLGSNKGWQPIVYKTTNSGVSWSLVPFIDFNHQFFISLKNSLKATATNTSLVIPHFNIKEGIDATVDMNGNLHIASTVVGTVSNHNDSLDYTYLFKAQGYQWPHSPGARPYIYDFVTNGSQWTYAKIDSLSTEIPGIFPTDSGYVENPWNLTSGTKKVASGARVQLSRNDNGTVIVYTYAESDTNFTNNGWKWNQLPNIKARTYLVYANNILQSEINITKYPISAGPNNPNVNSRAMFHYAAPLTGSVSGTGGFAPGNCYTQSEYVKLSLAVTVSNSSPYDQDQKSDHWFSKVNLTFSGNSGFGNSFPPFGYPVTDLKTSANDINEINIYPNPTSDIITANFNSQNFEKIILQITNSLGQLIKTGEAGTENNSVQVSVKDLPNGVYVLSVINDVTNKSIVSKRFVVAR